MQQEDSSIVISDRISETDELGAFLEKTSCAALFVYPDRIFRGYDDFIVRRFIMEGGFDQSPQFGKYVREILDRKVNSEFVFSHEKSIKLEISKPSDIDMLQRTTRLVMRQGWDLPTVWQWVGTGLAFGCAAGGSKALLDLMKLWVEERKGRRIKIKKGDVELEIVGGISSAEIQKILELFEEKFGKSKIIRP